MSTDAALTPVPPPDQQCVGPQSAQAGLAPSCRGCPNAAACAAAPKGPDPDLPLIAERLAPVRHRVLVLSGKGGVGKSTLTKELGFALGRGAAGLAVGLLDADLTGPSLPRLTGALDEGLHQSAGGWEPVGIDEGVSLVSVHHLLADADRGHAITWRGPQKNAMIKTFLKEVAWGELDVLLVDTPPGTSDEHISLVTLLRDCGGITGAVIVTTPQEVALADVRREVSFCKKTKIPIIGVVENMKGFVCPNCDKASEPFPTGGPGPSAGERLAAECGAPLLGAVPLDPRLMAACERGEAAAPGGAAAEALAAIAAKVEAALRAIDDEDAPQRDVGV